MTPPVLDWSAISAVLLVGIGAMVVLVLEVLLADRETIFWKHAKGKAIRDGDWKLVAQAGGEWELYDLDADPTELDDLSGEKPDKVDALKKKWNQWLKTQQKPPR